MTRRSQTIRPSHSVFLSLVLCLALVVIDASAAASFSGTNGYYVTEVRTNSQTTISLRIGEITESRTVVKLPPNARLKTTEALSAGDCLFLSILIPNDFETNAWNFEVLLNGTVINRRNDSTKGFGLRSFFIPVPASLITSNPVCALEAVNRATTGELCVHHFSVLRNLEPWLTRPLPTNDFGLSLLIDPGQLESTNFNGISLLKTSPSIRKSLSAEIYYANMDETGTADIIAKINSWHDRYRLPFLLNPASWWMGTPWIASMSVYAQQICWSESDNYDEGADLHYLLGDRWDLRFGLTTPNMWGNTPWRNMNLPNIKWVCDNHIQQVVPAFESALPDKVFAYVSENEPAYWADGFPDQGYPVQRTNLWADFNPYTVADAADDGVALDPRDGLSLQERLWLLYNIGNYNQDRINALHDLVPNKAKYTHGLIGDNRFPMGGTGHYRPYAESLRVNNARPGVEMLGKVDLDALLRIREWGNWACVNREENDGYGMEWHLAMLQATYFLGADFLNSYNWQTVNQSNKAINYFNSFFDCINAGTNLIPIQKQSGTSWFTLNSWTVNLNVPYYFPWFNGIKLNLRTTAPTGNLSLWVTRGSSVVAYKIVTPADVAGISEYLVDFGDLAKAEQNDVLQLRLQAASGWEIQGKNLDPNYKLVCDLRRERARSQYIMQRPASITAANLIRPWRLLTPVQHPDGTIQIEAQGSVLANFTLQCSTNLTQWDTVATLDADAVGYTDPNPTNAPARFYRVWMP